MIYFYCLSNMKSDSNDSSKTLYETIMMFYDVINLKKTIELLFIIFYCFCFISDICLLMFTKYKIIKLTDNFTKYNKPVIQK